MTEEQRKAALDALEELADWANKGVNVCKKGKTVPDISSLRQIVCTHLQAPPVPVIEGLEGSMQLLIMIENSYSREAEECRLVNLYLTHEVLKEKSNMIRKCIKAAEEYSKLQKGD